MCDTVSKLIDDTVVVASDAFVDLSPEMSAAREATDILCTATLKGLLHLHDVKPLPSDWLDRLPDIPSRLRKVFSLIILILC